MESESDAAVVEHKELEATEPGNEPGPEPEAEPAPDGEAGASEIASAGEPEARAASDGDPANAAEPADATEPATEPAPQQEAATIAPPVIAAIEPAHGPATRATAVRIRGEGFADGCVVRAGEQELATRRDDDGALVVEIPASELGGFVDLAVVNPDGGRELRPNAFAYDLPPWVGAVEPAIVPVSGGVAACVTGKGFAEGAIARVDGVAIETQRAGDDRLDVILPAHAEGIARLEVETPDGQVGALDGALEYREGPVVRAIEPAEGPPAGGTEVVVVGQRFRPGMRVTFFDAFAVDVRVESDTRLRFVTPRHEAGGSGAIVVVDPDGLRSRVEGAFTYRDAEAPRIDEVSPARGLVTGGTRVSITGSGFEARSVVRVGGVALPVQYEGPALLRVITTAVAEPAAVDLEIENPDGQKAHKASAFAFVPIPTPPKLISIAPDRALKAGGAVVTIHGDNFDEDTAVRIGEVTATRRLVSRTELEVQVPPRDAIGKVAVELLAPGGVVVRVEDAFTYEDRPPPRITSVTPAFGPTSGGTKVVIEGEHLGDVFVRIGREQPKSVLARKADRIEILTPPSKTAGFVDIEVGVAGLPTEVRKSAFRYDALPAPVITSVAPPKGGVAGGTEIGIVGKSFVKESVVLVGGKPAKKTKFVDASNLEAITPPGDAGQMVDVVVQNPDGKQAIAKRAFMYDPRYR